MTSTRSYPKQRSAIGTAFRWHWRKNRLLLVLYTLLLVVALPGCFFLNLLYNTNAYLQSSYYSETIFAVKEVYLAQEMVEYLNSIFTWMVIPITAAFAFLMAYSSFSYLHSRRATDLYAALPIRRTPMLMGGILANLLQLFLPLAATLGLVQAIGWGYGDLVYPFSGILIWEAFGLLVLGLTATYLLFLFMIAISGTLLDTVFSFAVLSVSWPLLWLIMDTICEQVLPGYVSDLNMNLCFALVPLVGTMLPFFDFDSLYCFPDGITNTTAPAVDTAALPYTPSLGWLAWWLLFVVVLLVVLVVVFRIRKSEYAESTHTFSLPRGFFRMICSAVGGLVLAYLCSAIFPSNVVFLVAGLLGTFLTHLFAQAIWCRGLRGFAKTLPSYLLLLVLMGTAGWMVVNDVPGYVTYLPDASEVASVEISGDVLTDGHNTLDYYLSTWDTGITAVMTNGETESYSYLYPELRSSESIAAVRAVHSAVLEQLSGPYLPFSEEEEEGTLYLIITYTLKDGSTVARRYWDISASDTLQAQTGDVLALEEYQQTSLLDAYEAGDVVSIDYCRYAVSVDWEEDAPASDDLDESYSYDVAYSYDVELTAEQKELLWSTFLTELYSEDFNYGSTEEDIDPDEDGYEEDCYINMDAIQREDFSPELLALLEQELDNDAELVTSITGRSYWVPACCTETRQLMREYAAAADAEAE
ncbi:MAG: hypothetical protein LIO78_02850 [Clostridiales bacterium]|nr:hypothetical protein [Clostridiales bacterium]